MDIDFTTGKVTKGTSRYDNMTKAVNGAFESFRNLTNQ